MTRIFVPQPIPEVALQRLRKLGDVIVFPHLDRTIDRPELLEAVEEAEILVAVGSTVYDREMIDAAPRLRMIAAMQTSTRLVDIDRAAERSVAVTVIPNLLASTTAEYTFALLLATAWRIPEAERLLKEGRWRQRQSMALLGTRVQGKTLGIVGAGSIGQGVARRAGSFGMKVVYTKRQRLDFDLETELGMSFRSLDDLFRESDFVALTLAVTPETTGLVDDRLLGLMKKESILINTSRGAIVDEIALERRLRAGMIRGAGLDVFEHEVGSDRIGPTRDLRELPNVVVTPHIGSAARETREEMSLRVVENIEAFLEGTTPPDLI